MEDIIKMMLLVIMSCLIGFVLIKFLLESIFGMITGSQVLSRFLSALIIAVVLSVGVYYAVDYSGNFVQMIAPTIQDEIFSSLL